MTTESSVVPFQANQNRLALAHDRRNVWSYVGPAGTTVEDLAAPERWANIASRIQTWDKIEFIEESGAFYAEFLVTSSDPSGLTLRPIKGIELGGQVGARGTAQRIPREFSVVNRGLILKWCVLQADKPLSEGHETEAHAYQWLHGHVATINKDKGGRK